MAEQNGGGLLDEVMGAVEEMAGGASNQNLQSGGGAGGGLLGEVMGALEGGHAQNNNAGGGLLGEVMSAVEGMLGGGAESDDNSGDMMSEVVSAVGGDKINELKEDYASGDIGEMKKDVGDVIDEVMGGKSSTKKTSHKAKKAAPVEEADQGGGLLDEVMGSVKGSATKAVEGEVINEVGGLLKGLLGGE